MKLYKLTTHYAAANAAQAAYAAAYAAHAAAYAVIAAAGINLAKIAKRACA